MYNDYPIIYESNINQMLIYYIIASIIILAVIIFTYFSLAKIYKKANRSGVSAIIPFYNILILLEIVNLPKWYFILLLIPGVNIIFYIKVMITLSKLFRKGKGFALGMVFLPFIFYPILAFNDSEYIGINLVAMEGKSTVVEIPKIVTEEENPTINEEVDEKSTSLNISIGGGTYQNEYTKSLIDVDRNQAIINNNINTSLNNTIQNNQSNIFINNNMEENNTTNQSINENTSSSDLDIMNNLNNLSRINSNINQSVQQNNQTENNSTYSINPQNNETKICPKCSALINSNSNTCFLCGNKL